MRLTDVPAGEAGERLLTRVYTELLAPSFPPAQLTTLESLRRGLATGATVVTVALDERPPAEGARAGGAPGGGAPADGTPVGVAVGEWSSDSGVLLLSYLAVAAGRRSGGVGSRLMAAVTGGWQGRYHPCLTVAEVAHPAAHRPHERWGDPAARLRFYARHRARALDLPYFQPALNARTGRVYGFLLLVLACRDAGRGPRPGTVAPEPVRRFLTEYLVDTEGGLGTDPAVVALWQAVERPEGIPLLPLDDPDRLPLSTPPTVAGR